MNRKFTGGPGGGGRGGRRMVLQLEETSSYLTKFGYHGRSETTDQPSESASDRPPPPDEQMQYQSDEEEPNYNGEDFRGDDLTPERIPPPSSPRMANGGKVDIDDKVANFLAEIDALEPGSEGEEAPQEEAPPNENFQVELPMASFILNESQNKAARVPEEKPLEKSKPLKSGAYSMFVKGQSEFIKPSRQEENTTAKKENQYERWPEEPKTKWNQIKDETTQYYYYWHVDTNEVTWEIPPEYTQYLLKKKDYEEKVERLLQEGRLRPEDNPKHKHKGKSSSDKDKGSDKGRHSEHSEKTSESKESSHSKHKESGERFDHSSSRRDKSPSRSSGTEDSDSSSSDSDEEKEDHKQKLVHYEVEVSGDIDSVSSSTSGENKKTVLRNRLPDERVEMDVPLSEIELPDSTDMDVKPRKVDKMKRRGSAESQGSEGVGKGTRPDSVEEKGVEGGSTEAREDEEDLDIEDIDRELEMALERKKAELLSLQANEKKKSASEEKNKEKDKKDDREKDKRKEKDHHHHHHRRKEEDRRKDRERSRERDRDRRKEDDRKKRDSRDDRHGRKDKDSKSSSSKDSGKKDQKREPEKKLQHSTLMDSVRKEVELKKLIEARKKKAIEELMAKELEEVAAKHGGRKRHSRDDDREEGRKRPRDEGPESSYRRGHDDFDDARRWPSRDEEDYRDRLERAYDRWDRPFPPPLSYDDPLYELERRERLHKPPPPTEEMVAYEVVDYGHRRGRPHEQEGDSDPDTRRSHEESIREKEVKKLEALQLAELSLSKLEFLEVTKKGLSKLQILLIELETRHQDWQSGGLTTEHFLSKLREANWQLQQYEDSAAPPGWSCHWDRAYRRYFYVNKKTSVTQWDYPTDLEEYPMDDDSGGDYNGDATGITEGEMVSSTTISTSRSSADSTLTGKKAALSGSKPVMKRATKEMLAGVAHLPPPPPPPAEEHPIVKGLQLMYGSSSDSEGEEEKAAPAPPPLKKKEESPPPKKKEKSPPPKKKEKSPPPKKRDRTPPPKKKKKEKKEKKHKSSRSEIGPQLPPDLPPEPSKSITPPPPSASGVPDSAESMQSVPVSAAGGETFYGAMPPPPPPPVEPVSEPLAGGEPVQGPMLPAQSEPPYGTPVGPSVGAGEGVEVSEEMDGVEFPEAQPVDPAGDTSTSGEGSFVPYSYVQQEEEMGDADSEHLYDVSEPSIHARPPEIAAVAAPAYYPPASVPTSSYIDPQAQVPIGPVAPEPSSSVDGIPMVPPVEGATAAPPPAGQMEDREKKKKKKDKSISSSIALKKRQVSSLVQKWQKVKKEVELEERNREERDAEIRRKLEEWKQEQS